MSGGLLILSFAVFICKVHSQLCSPPIIPPCPAPCPAPCVPLPCQPAIPPCPQVINSNPYVTTIVDNSVSNALVNAIQLLIVSNLIGATVGPSAPLLNNLGPLLDSLICSNPCPVEVIIPEYFNCGSYELASPYAPISTCGPYYDFIPPCVSIPSCPYYDFIPPCAPTPTCCPYYDLIPPCGCGTCGPIFEPYPPPLCGLPDFYPNYFTYTETLTPVCYDSIPYNGYGEVFYPYPGIETIYPNFCGGIPEIIPNYINYPIPEICPPINPFYCGYPDAVLPAVAVPNVYGCLSEVIAPCLPPIIYPEPYGPVAAVAPNFYGGLSELPIPLGGEVIFPGIPGPLPCNYGLPPPLPCVRVDGYNSPVYY